jgi:predicted methyltransferase
MEKYGKLRKIYKRFVHFEKEKFTEDVEKWLGVKELFLSTNFYKKIYENYYKPTFVEFINRLRYSIFEGPSAFLKKTQEDIWHLLWLLQFLESENIIRVERNKIKILDKNIFKGIITPIPKEQILKILQKKLKIPLFKYSSFPVFSIFSKFGKGFKWKEYYDQQPISTSSAILILKKILEYLPLEEKMLFVGDDDFISILLGLINSQIKITVVDIDDEVLDVIEKVSKKFELSIDLKKIDVEKGKIREKFISFLTNPPYTEDGVKTFVKFGTSCLGKDGGICFLEVGNESIEKRFLFLQEFFAKSGLWLNELLPGFISYPYVKHEEFDLIIKEFDKMQLDVKNNILSASLYIFSYVPWRVKKLKFRRKIYSYI